MPREIIEALREPFLVLDREYRVVAASPPFYLEFGLEAGQAEGAVVYDLQDGAWAGTALRELLERSASSHALVEDCPLAVPVPAGDVEHTLCTIRPVREGVGRIELFLLSFRRSDPPARPEMPVASLRRLAGEHVTDVVALYGLDGSCLYVGNACEAVLGYPADEWTARRACDVVHPDDREMVRRHLSPGGPGDAPSRITVRVMRKNGEYLWMDTSVRMIRDPEIGPLVHTSSRDVTRQRRAEEAIQWLSRHTKLILDSAADGIFGIDMRGLITFINPAAAHALGYAAADLTGRPYGVLVPRGAACADDIASVLRVGEATGSSAGAFVRRDGTRVTVEYACTPARQRGQIVGGVVTFRDVTERLRADAALRRAYRLEGVGQTILALRHEINNPLTTLLAEASLLEIGGNPPHEEREMIASIADQARRIRDAVRRLAEQADDPAGAAPRDPGRR